MHITIGLILTSFYDVALWSAVFPLIYLIMMVAAGMRHSFGLSIWSIILRAIAGWGLILFFYCLCGQLCGYAFQDLGAFIDAPKKGNPFIRYYPVGVFLVGMAGFWYPRADLFNVNRTRTKRIVLCIICFVPLYLMIAYLPLVSRDLWPLCLKFGIRSSMLAFTISFPIIVFNLPDSLSLIKGFILQFLFCLKRPVANKKLENIPEFKPLK